MKRVILPLFALTCLAQWYIPGKMISDQEKILSEGTTFRFKTAPIDPADPFRGKYITLSFEEDHVEVVNPSEWQQAQDVFVTLRDSAGFAKIDRVSMYEPEGDNFLRAKIRTVTSYEPYTLWLSYPFERFYLEESKASEAERLYWSTQSDSTQQVYAVVNILKGEAALKDVMINDRRIADVVKEINDRKD
ncbi:MAG TPA: GDYXXLXY domain-containing protein [Ohtaekwangia sp.]|nr:GDYXXLXY domain-containing protein [Ohtaekwangia sp.]